MIQHMKYNIRTLVYLLAGVLLLTASCKKSNDSYNSEDTKSTLIKDLAGDTLASMGEGVEGKEQRPFHPFLFRFSDQKQVFLKTAKDSADFLKNGDWDLCFGDIYNSLVSCNSGTLKGSPGFGGPGKGAAIVIIDKPYDQVHEAPADDLFIHEGRPGVGWDPGNGNGWFFYSLSNHLVVPVKNRTFVLKTADGKFAKLELINVYKGNPPLVVDLFWPAPYFTFRYYVQQDGSRNISTL